VTSPPSLTPESRWSDEHVEQFIGRLLQFGVILAAAVTLFGAIILLAHNGGTVADFRVFKGASPELRSVGAIVRGVIALDGRAITQLGLVLLILTPVARVAQQAAGLLPDAIQRKFMQKAGVDRMAALLTAIDIVRRGGTISLVGVYGGMADPMPMLQIFDKQIQLRMGQANVRRWSSQILPLLTDEDPLHVDSFATHHLPLSDGPAAYESFQQKNDGMVKVLLNP